MNRFKNFDGTGRPPRPIQVEILNWLSQPEVWDRPVIGFNVSPGAGKSALLASVARLYGSPVMVPTNQLMSQIIETYPQSNYLKGKNHYHCKDHEVSCGEVKDIIKDKPCKGCVYQACRRKALSELSYVNPLSYYHLKKHKDFKKPKVLLVDEADKVFSMLRMLSGKDFRKKKYGYPDIQNVSQLVAWMEHTVVNLRRVADRHLAAKNFKELSKITSEIENIEFTCEGLKLQPENYAYYIHEKRNSRKVEEYLSVHPIDIPSGLIGKMFDSHKLIVTSATLFESDMRAFALGKKYVYKDFGSPIPKENRPVLFQPIASKVNKDTEPEKIANWIKNILTKYPDRNTLVHITYSWALKLKKYFPEAIVHDKDNKQEMIEKFKKEGGLFLASGCAEGVDLPYDECRLNIIPIIHKMNLGDPVVQKRKARSDGEYWYWMEMFRVLIQQAGRSTRSADDKSVIVVGDPMLPRLVTTYRRFLPSTFVDSINWRG